MPDVNAKVHDLLFAVRRSTRYHARRRKHFDRLNRATVFFSVMFGSATFASLQSYPDLAPYIAGAVTVLSALDLALGNAVRARDHHDFERRWIALERKIVRTLTHTEESYAALCEERLEIEAEEEPPLRVLDVLCHNEQVLADDRHDYLYKVSWIQRRLSQWMDLGADKPFKRVTNTPGATIQA